MRSPFAKLRWLTVAAVLAVAAFWAGHSLVVTAAQTQQPFPSVQTPSNTPPFGDPPDPNDPIQRQRMEKMEKARNTDRQKQLELDTEKLLSLAKELKEDVNKSNKDTLSIDVVKKAAEIEKLAKSVKERMRG